MLMKKCKIQGKEQKKGPKKKTGCPLAFQGSE